MPVPQIALLLAASLAAPAGGGAKPSVPAFDQNDVLGSIRRIRRSPTPEARAIARQIESGPHDLALQRAAARQDGMPLSPAQLEATTPPAALNAALVYAWLARVLEARPQDSRTLQIAGRLGAGRATTPDELAAVRKMREKRQDAIDLIHRATDRPRCAFRPDWSRGPPLLIREFSTTAAHFVEMQPTGRWLTFNNSNALVKSTAWDIQLQKTGYIREAGRCLVMLATISGRPFVIVLLDSNGKYTRLGDAQRVKHWLETGESSMPTSAAASGRYHGTFPPRQRPAVRITFSSRAARGGVYAVKLTQPAPRIKPSKHRA